MILSFLFYFVVAYLLYRLVFNFILPVYRTTQQIKKGFRSMNEQMNGQATPNPPNSGTQAQKPSTQAGEYIDFEEV